MLKKLLITALFLASSQIAFSAETAKTENPMNKSCALVGTWKSDKEKTMPALNKDVSIPVGVKARMADLFGKVTITYNPDCNQAIADVNGKQNTLDFKVVKNTPDSITIEDSRSNNQHTMHFEGDCYLMEVTGVGVDEYYCRVGEKK